MSNIATVHAYNRVSYIEDVNPPKIVPIEKAASEETITTYFDTKTGAVVSESNATPADPNEGVNLTPLTPPEEGNPTT